MVSMSADRRHDVGVLARYALDEIFAPFRKVELPPGRGRWIKILRQALGMTTGQLAKRIGVSQPRITAIEKAEASGAITLNTLKMAAEGLNCTLVYVLLPNVPLDAMIKERAEKLATEQVRHTHQTMKLENQALEPGPLKRARERLIDDLLRGDPRRLWDEP